MALVLDPFAGLTAFVRVADAGSFAAAARLVGTAPSALSKSVARLERRLEVRLLQRTTRALRLTQEGQALHARAKAILADLDEAEAAASTARSARGRLCVSAPMDFGRDWLMPRLPAFLAAHPGVHVDLMLTDRFVDLVAEGIDVAVRMGETHDHRLVRRTLGRSQQVICASPKYLRKHGVPRRLEDLAKHAGLAYLRDGRPVPWTSWVTKRALAPAMGWVFGSDSNQCLRTAALAGLGLARMPRLVVASELASGALRAVLEGVDDEGGQVHLVYPEQRLVPGRLRAFLDFVVAEFPRG